MNKEIKNQNYTFSFNVKDEFIVLFINGTPVLFIKLTDFQKLILIEKIMQDLDKQDSELKEKQNQIERKIATLIGPPSEIKMNN